VRGWFVALGAAALLTQGCSSSTNGAANVGCSAYPTCPNDPAGPKQLCQTELNDPNCGARFQVYLNCAAANHSCDTSGHVQISPSCDDAAQPWVTCITANLDSGLGTE